MATLLRSDPRRLLAISIEGKFFMNHKIHLADLDILDELYILYTIQLPYASLRDLPQCGRLLGFAQIPSLKGPNLRQFPVLRAQVSTDNSSTSNALKKEPLNGKVGETIEEERQAEVPESVISAFMAEVSDLVKLVDSRDITELQLKQKNCELIIRKKEALPQAASSAPVVMMQPSPQAMYAPQPPGPSIAPQPAAAAAPPASAPAALPASAKASKSSHPPLKCPMAGTFYRCAAPGEPPFVKVGDKVKKGQVVCIIEAMKLMNEIEADQDGTVVDIIAEDGKPVSVDTPLLVIEP
ncbi:biotin carboxyl carrier protein of acetyl-CoA carboxylase 1, chloroplastic-like [Asparagus officinalis]|uniref:biotin carboxyl carrier protein of acetyl-CoA carboxylase 1, chloroplastic-like n=1 Tax=Asparagus officinalis TaxID=4686 RepID=UPI00098E1C16|nr:biotin carboxyl carrier protein of acetyl-CoA carboxylase 1, chloroplastic-like [Asparagus officinalis]